VRVPDGEIRTNETEVRKMLDDLKTNKSPGPDGMHPSLLKKLARPLTRPLTLLFNMTFESQAVPSDWKTARICAIHKKGDTRLASNYRPVSLTSIVSKLCEKIVRKHIMDHLTANELLAPTQYGFIPGRNISLQLLRVLDDWTEAWDDGEEIDCAYLDFAKAFDRVPHNRLVAKLDSFAICRSTVNWIKSFLTSREQVVVVGEASSERVQVTSGIPQGSVMGPILFVLFINDLPDGVSNTVLLFADDTKLYARNNLPGLQEDLRRLEKWSQDWMLNFNTDKCKHFHIGLREPSDRLIMDSKPLTIVDSEKDLGVIFERSLLFKKHINEKISTANKMFGIIRRSFKHLNIETFLPLYKGMVRSHLDFAASVYHPIHKNDNERIEGVQRRATKQLPEINNLPYQDRLKKLKLPTLAYRRLRSDMIELYKATSAIYEPNLCSFIKLRTNETTRQSNRTHNKSIYPTHSNSNIRKHAFCNRNVTIWNNLPHQVVNAPSVPSFKNHLDKHWKNHPLQYDHTADPRMQPPSPTNSSPQTPQED